MRAGRLSDWLVFERRVVTDLANGGGTSISWVSDPDVSTWGEVVPAGQNAQFIIRYKTGIDGSTYRIVWNGKIWLITTADPDRRRTSLTIDCQFSEFVEATTLLSTEREYVQGIPTVHP